MLAILDTSSSIGIRKSTSLAFGSGEADSAGPVSRTLGFGLVEVLW